jgi:hypothetical protein
MIKGFKTRTVKIRDIKSKLDMKRFYFFVLTASLLITATGCTVIEENDKDNEDNNTESLITENIGGAYSYAVSASGDWKMTPDQSWCTVTPTSGTGSSNVTISMEPNDTGNDRNVTITVVNGSQTQTITLTQQGTAQEQSVLYLSPANFSLDANAASKSFAVMTDKEWAVTSNQEWCTVSPKSGKADGKISFSVETSTESTPRTAAVTVRAGAMLKTVTVTQSSGFNVSTENLTFSATAGNATVSILSVSKWTVESDRSWCTVSPASGSSSGEVTVSVLANADDAERSATLTVKVGEKTEKIVVKQASAALSLSAESFELTAAKDEGSFDISSNTGWTVTSDQSWCTVSQASGSNHATVKFNVTTNTATARTATITVKAGNITKQITVSQEAPALTVSDEQFSVLSSAGSASFNITSNTEWTVAGNRDWCTVSQVSGSKNAVISFSVKENATAAERTATITVSAGSIIKTITVTQAAAESKLSVSPDNFTVAATNGSNTFTIASSAHWTVSSNQSWCTVSPSSGSNNGTVTITTAANTTNAARTAVITVTSGAITKQVTAVQPALSFSLSMNNFSMSAASGSNSFTVTGNTGWTATSNQSWCTVSPASGTGNGSVTFSLTANTTNAERTASIAIKSGNETQTVSISQQGANASFSVSQNAFSLSSTAGNNSLTVTGTGNWTAVSNQSWCTVSPASGTGSGTVNIATAANTTNAPRTATITVTAGTNTQTVTVTQQSSNATFAISQNSFHINSAANIKTFNITCNSAWTVASNQSWCTVVPASGSGNGTVSFTATANTVTAARTAIITVKSGTETLTVTVLQQNSNTLTVSQNNITVDAAGGEKTFNVQSTTSWTASCDQSWCTVSPASSSENHAVTAKISANTGTNARNATITITDGVNTKTVSVSQQGISSSLSVSKNSFSVAASGGTNTFNIFKTEKSNWELYVSSDQTWCRVIESNGTATVTTSENATTASRTATVTVIYQDRSNVNIKETQTVTVSQQSANLNVSTTDIPIDIDEAYGNKTFDITSNANWTITSNQSWLKVSSTSGTGSQKITVTTDENTTPAIRTATLTVEAKGAQTKIINVSQNYYFYIFYENANHTGTISITKSEGMSTEVFTVKSNKKWAVSSDQAWCTVSPLSGSNDGTVTYSVAPNSSIDSRNATVTVTSGTLKRMLAIKQNSVPTSLTLSPAAFTMGLESGSNKFTITSNANWTVSSDQSWCTFSPASGSKNRDITFNVTKNEGTASRTAKITVKNIKDGITTDTKTVQITQENSVSKLSVSKNYFQMFYYNNSNNFTITSNTSWTISSDQPWCTLSEDSGSGNKSVTFNVTKNEGTTSRTATITASYGNNQQVKITVTQVAITLSASKANISLAGIQSGDFFTVTSDVSTWTVSSNQAWCSVTKDYYYDRVNVSATENLTGAERTATITVSISENQFVTVTVTQAKPTLSISKMELNVSKTPSSPATITVTSNVSSWTVNSNSSWCDVSKNGNSVVVTVSPNTTGNVREAIITVSLPNDIKTIHVFQRAFDVGEYYNINGVKGIVYKIQEDGISGMIVSLDQTEAKWWNSSNYDDGTGANNMSDGLYNMERIKLLDNWDTHAPAFAWCDAKNINGITGWYLPAIDEWKDIHSVRSQVNTGLSKNGGAQINSSNYYWSSTESGTSTAYYYYYDYDRYASKNTLNYVRAVKAF